MEEELIAQRDAAIAVTKELQRQFQQRREMLERTFERRALTAERLRFHAEEELRRVQEDRDWEAQMCHRLLYLSLFCGMIGAIVGWLLGLLVLLLLAQPLFGFLLILPGMACGSLMGLAIAKTKVQLEIRRREAKRKQKSRHAEVEMAVHSSVDGADEPLEPLEHHQGMENVSQQLQESPMPSSSYTSLGYHVVMRTWQTSFAIAQSLYQSKSYVNGMFQPSTESLNSLNSSNSNSHSDSRNGSSEVSSKKDQ